MNLKKGLKTLLFSSATVIIGSVISAIFATLMAKKTSITPVSFFTGVFSSKYYIGAILNTALLLTVSGLGAGASLINGEFNLGGEGQIYAGGFVCAIVACSMKNCITFFAVATAAICAMGISALIALFSALLKYYKNTSILLTSFLISSAIIPVINSLIAGPFKNSGNLLATEFIPQSMRIAQIMQPSPLNAAIILVPMLCACSWYIINKTAFGRKIVINGIAPEFGKYCGYNQKAMLFSSMAISGALHGLTGFLAVFGTYFTCHSGFYAGMGWNALTTALTASSNPIAIIPSALTLSWIFTSADKVTLTGNFGFNFSALVQGIMLFCISIKRLKK